MAASKLFSLIGPSILRYNSLSFVRPHHFNRTFFLNSSSRWCSSSALAIDSDDTTSTHALTTDAVAQPPHPWPEWVSFVDRLKSKGYLSPTQNDELVYTDINAVKDACLKFARQHFHIFKSLSTQDIQTTVGKGCPNLLRKAVNSAKRLRAHVELNESEVCGSCDLRGSCNRADNMPSNSEPARTVDIVRILYFYALDPVVMSGGNKPPGGELVEASVRKLLSELIELGETAFDPEILQRAAVTATRKKKTPFNLSETGSQRDNRMRRGDWLCSGCNHVNFAKNIRCLKCKADNPIPKGNRIRNVKPASEVVKRIGDWDCTQCNYVNLAKNIQCLKCKAGNPMRIGDWDCPQCNYVNFARNRLCLKCKAYNPNRIHIDKPAPEVGKQISDWDCPRCNFMNFSRNIQCLKCRADNPNPVYKLSLVSEKVERKRGDWDCPKCSFVNYASQKECFSCSEPRPARDLEPGQWECPKCDSVNFERDSCKKCNHDPACETTMQHDLPTWKRPY